MRVIKTLHRSAIIGLTTVVIGVGIAQADAMVYKPDSEFLTRWQATYDGLLNMKPKWGKQGVEVFKTSTDAGVPVVFLNVCTSKEWQDGVIKDALLITLNELPKLENLARLPEDRNTNIGVHCKSGYRSTLALLHQLGYKNTINMSGGIKAWRKAGYPVVTATK